MRDNLERKTVKNKKDYTLKLCFLFIGISIFSFLVYFFIQYINQPKVKDFIPKKEQNKEYVYTIKKQENLFEDDSYFEIPTINLEGEKFENINQAILNNYNTLSTKSEYDYGYEFNRSKEILSLKITYAYYPDSNTMYPMRFFETFNIDLTTGKILTSDEILKRYHLTPEKVNHFLEAKFKKMYTDLVAQKYYTEKECNYSCFLKNRGISNQYLNGSSYYIENNSLTLFKYFYTDSSYNEIEYFKDQTYQFIVKE